MLEGLPCTLCCDPTIMWHIAAMIVLLVRRILHCLLDAFNIKTGPLGQHIGSQILLLLVTLSSAIVGMLLPSDDRADHFG